MAVLGGGIDELDVEGLEVGAAGGGHDGLAEGDGSLLGAGDTALDHEPVLVDLTIVGETTDGRNTLLGEVSIAGSGVVHSLLAHAKHTLVDLGTVVVAHLTGAGHSGGHASRVPGADTGDLAKTTVSLSGKSGDTPTGDNTGKSLTLGGGADIDALTLSEHSGAVELLLEHADGEVDLVGDGSTVDLDLEDLGHLLAKLDLAVLGVGDDAHDGGVLLDLGLLSVDLLGLLGVLLGVLGEGLALGLVPVLVESALHVIRQVLSPHGGKGTKAVGGGNVADHADDNHGGGLEDGDRLDSLLLVELGAGALDLTDAVSHTGLEGHESGQVTGGRGIVLGEGSDATSVVSGTLLRKVLQGAATRVLEFTVRHDVVSVPVE
jgi:hypothetical protein